MIPKLLVSLLQPQATVTEMYKSQDVELLKQKNGTTKYYTTVFIFTLPVSVLGTKIFIKNINILSIIITALLHKKVLVTG
jgi:hypothetical protein